MTEVIGKYQAQTCTIEDLDTLTLDSLQVMRDVPADKYEALKETIRAGRLVYPVVVDHNGAVIDGHQRIAAYWELRQEGEHPPPVAVQVIDADLTDVEKRTLARELNMNRRQLTESESRKMIREQLLETPEWGDGRIAVCAGVSRHRVRRMREDLENRGEIPYHTHLLSLDNRLFPRDKISNAPTKLERMVESELYRESKRGAHFKRETLPARAELASPENQGDQKKQQRLEKKAFAKACFALQQLAEAIGEPPKAAARQAELNQAALLSEIYGPTTKWLRAFMKELDKVKEGR